MAGGRKFALLVGCNYPNSKNELYGCYNDVQNMKNTLIDERFGFNLIKVLTDDANLEDKAGNPNELIKPTGENIRRELISMVNHARRDDLLFFYFSGHGTKVQHLGSKTSDAAIIASDFNLITGADLMAIVDGLPARVTFIVMADSDHSEGLLDESPPNQVILLSACTLEEYRHEINIPSATRDYPEKVGAFSNAVQTFLSRKTEPVSYMDIKANAGLILRNQMVYLRNQGEHFVQHPCLRCSSESHSAIFLQGSGRGNVAPESLREVGRKKLALLVGCNYPNTKNELNACYNDVQNMKETLTDERFGFNLIKVLTDDPNLKDEPDNTNELIKPTGENIKRELNSMVDHALPDDLLFFYFSGHGTKVQHLGSGTTDVAIIASDFNLITGADLTAIVNRLPVGVTFTIMADCDHSEGLFDENPPNQVIFLGGCGIDKYRNEVTPLTGRAGAFTNAFQMLLMDTRRPVSNMHIKEQAGLILGNEDIDQDPCLRCSNENRAEIFLLQGIERP